MGELWSVGQVPTKVFVETHPTVTSIAVDVVVGVVDLGTGTGKEPPE